MEALALESVRTDGVECGHAEYLQCLLEVHSEKQQSKRMMIKGWRWYRVRHTKRTYIIAGTGWFLYGADEMAGWKAVFKT